ncbi:hypothetical protein PMPD1_2222 [Paramixta manurensis]|uniref:Uncharacterized protein n=1 Tax=Paramixta manurensis TaxID=2740817 RepID=A0A6M8UFD5_9GAMM|nr:hypothetical protein PMPD1_2222 [Erwiniaceae bacterium PD-1]
MKKGMMLCVLLALSGGVHAAGKTEAVYTGPDCSKDTDGRIFGGLWDSVLPNTSKYKKYVDILAKKDTILKITRLSSEKISKKEAERLMYRRAKKDGIKQSEIKDRGIVEQYLGEDLYRQYYLIESNKKFKAIAEFYSSYLPGDYPVGSKTGESCGNDIENIYIISDSIYGHTEDFSSR